MFRSEYVNCTLAGVTEHGEPVAFIAGKHQQNFPYYTPQSKWDSVLLLIGGEAYAISDRELPGLAFELDLRAGRGTAHLRFAGPLRARDGRRTAGALHLVAAFRRFPAYHLGKPFPASWLPGLAWTPYQLQAAPGAEGRVEVAGVSRAVSRWGGQLEHGAFASLPSRRIAIAYDYVALACPAYAHVTFSTYPLDGGGPVGKALCWYLARTAATEITLEDGVLHAGNPRGAGRDLAVIRTDTVDLGLADLDRQLVSASDEGGTPLLGLREVFHRK